MPVDIKLWPGPRISDFLFAQKCSRRPYVQIRFAAWEPNYGPGSRLKPSLAASARRDETRATSAAKPRSIRPLFS